MVKSFFYITLALVVLMAIYLSIFEALLQLFQMPFGSNLNQHEAHDKIWHYLLAQEYESFIELEALSLHEKRHLLDVKRILESTYTLWMFVMPFAIVVLILFFNKIVAYIFYMGLAFNVSTIALFGYNFLSSFDTFHTFFFVHGSWRFSHDSLIIEIFPLHYFQEFFILFMLLSSLLFFLLYVLKSQ